jgi:hypothetical protein
MGPYTAAACNVASALAHKNIGDDASRRVVPNEGARVCSRTARPSGFTAASARL